MGKCFQKGPITSLHKHTYIILPLHWASIALFSVSSGGTVSLGLVNGTEKTNCFRYSQIKHCSWVIYLLLFRASLILGIEV